MFKIYSQAFRSNMYHLFLRAKMSTFPSLNNFPKQHNKNHINKKGYSFVAMGVLGSFFKTDNKMNLKLIENTRNAGPRILSYILSAEENYLSNDYNESKKDLQFALDLAESAKEFENIWRIFELLATMSFEEDSVLAAEEKIIRFIEKLQQYGYEENDDCIMRFKLRLSRLYEDSGNLIMAEIGFRNCIDMLEEKLKKAHNNNDMATNLIYVNTLFWYSHFLTYKADLIDLVKAKRCIDKLLKQLDKPNVITLNQLITVLDHASEIQFKAKNYDEAINYLSQAVVFCEVFSTKSSNYAKILLKLGMANLHKNLLSEAEFWFIAALENATKFNDSENIKEAKNYIEKVSNLLKTI